MPTIFCIGKNYAAHAREMGDSAEAPSEPVVFLKPEQALLRPPAAIRLPVGAGEVHHEAELVVRVGEGATVEAVAVGLDLTDRTLQGRAKEKGHPWAAAKGFFGAAPVGPFVPAPEAPPLDRIRFTLAVNGRVRQRGDTALLMRPIPLLLERIDAWFRLRPGDLVFTGTPQGVAPIGPGDVLELQIEDLPAAAARFEVAR